MSQPTHSALEKRANEYGMTIRKNERGNFVIDEMHPGGLFDDEFSSLADVEQYFDELDAFATCFEE